MSETPVFTDLRRTFEWTCPECGSDHYDVGEVDGQILTCEGCSQTVLVRWAGLSAEGVVAEEPEWEYGTIARFANGLTYSEIPWGSREQAEQVIADSEEWESDATDDTRMTYELVKRVPEIKPGPWVPVMQES